MESKAAHRSKQEIAAQSQLQSRTMLKENVTTTLLDSGDSGCW